MNKDLLNFLFLIVGILFGIGLSIGLKYPLEIKTIDQVKYLCQNQSIKKIKIGISGKINEIQCEDMTIFKLN